MKVSKLTDLKKEYEDIEIPVYELDEVVKNALTTSLDSVKPKRKLNWQTIAGVAVLVIALISVVSFTPAGANLMQNIRNAFPKVVETPQTSEDLSQKYTREEEEGLRNALSLGLGQIVNQSVTNQNVTINLDGIVSDGNRTVLLLSANSDAVNLKGVNLDLYPTEKNKKIEINGKQIEGGMGNSFYYDEKKNQAIYIIDIWDTKKYAGKQLSLSIENLETSDNDIYLKGEWNFSVMIPDLSTVKNLTTEVDIKAHFEYKGTKYNLNKIVFTPFETTIFGSMPEDSPKPFNWENGRNAYLQTSAGKQGMKTGLWTEGGKLEIGFGPTKVEDCILLICEEYDSKKEWEGTLVHTKDTPIPLKIIK
ncbi:MAG: hypothetical protein K0R71_2074 [Bacillales bacterium]|jgi:hypothetical protein|nr:hypothetical protein [Bacillales bacterium]